MSLSVIPPPYQLHHWQDLTHTFYGHSHTKSYSFGCSYSDRQGIHSADVFPHDFDGIIAGAPVIDLSNLVSWRASFFPTTGTPDSHQASSPHSSGRN
ncbi:hypothetical protein EYZ11_006466 [Aspergillus tanneri]|uniref:Carboxylic ester hydrolase n=1 Tax=Aspergillus tanneri TaxID=1220188 RepID=A0A4S3JHP7_9EURO|nr:hypothetical protein EYZ11_006466 [Aspergillus tanneri]